MEQTAPDLSSINLAALTAAVDDTLAAADADLELRFPGERAGRQPIHTVYVPADRFAADLFTSYAATALQAVDDHADTFRDVVHNDDDLIERVKEKIGREPVEDLRIDFEDGYGPRSDDEEDGAAVASATALRQAIEANEASPFHGIRFKCLERPTRARGLRTLALFMATLTNGGPLPDGFVVTLPKVTSVDQVTAMVLAAERIESDLNLAVRSLRFEIQIETPQSILGPDGTALVARMIHAAEGRCTGLHYGTYDYSAFCGIAAGYQSMEHPVADHAKAIMQAAAAGTGVRLSDGSTNILPLGDAESVRSGWALHQRLVRRSLERGYYQGWDLHPAQLPTRYAATFGFYREGFGQAAKRLRNFVERTGSGILDEPATARALSDFLLRGTDCGAFSTQDVLGATGLDAVALATLARRTTSTTKEA